MEVRDEASLVEKAQAGDREAMGALLNRYGAMIGLLAKRDRYREYADARQDAAIDAMDAIRRYKPDAGLTLKNWIFGCVIRRRLDRGHQSLLHSGRIRRNSSDARKRLAASVRIDLPDVRKNTLARLGDLARWDDVEGYDLRDAVEYALSLISPRSAEIVTRYFGLGRPQQSMKHTAEAVGLSEGRLSQLLSSILETIGSTLSRELDLPAARAPRVRRNALKGLKLADLEGVLERHGGRYVGAAAATGTTPSGFAQALAKARREEEEVACA